MHTLQIKTKWILPFAFFTLLFFSSGLHKALNLKPVGVHQWRQTDCASIALNYYQNNTPFLKPQMHNQTGTNGYSASEFPIVYFITGQLYHVFGFHEWIFRCINLLFFFSGLFFLFLLVKKFTNDRLAAMIPIIIAGTSPYYFFYGAHFLPNVPAISLCFIGWYFFFEYLKNFKTKNIYITAFFFGLAGLMKVSDLLSFFAAGTYLLYLIVFGKNKISFEQIKHILLSGTLVFIAVATWIFYCVQFNAKNGTDLSLLGILPIWNLDGKQIADIWSRFYTAWSLHIFHPVVWIALGLSLLIYIIQFKMLHHVLRAITLILFIGSIIYLLLFFDALYHHDYYMLTPFPALIFLCITITEFIVGKINERRTQLRTIIACIAITIIFIVVLTYNHRMQNHRLYAPEYKNVSDNTYELEKYIRSIGILRTDKVVSVPDKSSNISLYLMNNPGWTEVYTKHKFTMKDFLNKGAQYLIIGDSSYLEKPEYTPYLQKQIGVYKNFMIYDLQ